MRLEKQGEQQKTKTDLIMWKPVSEYKGGRVLATNDVDILVGYINSDGDCESEDCEGTLLCGITGFVEIEDVLPPKQGEQKPADKVEPKFKVKYAGSEYNVLEVKDIAGVTYYGIEDEPNHIDYVQAENCERVGGYSIKENGSPYPTKPAKFSDQKPAWSEEDEKIRKELIDRFKSLKPNFSWYEVPIDNILVWLERQGERKPIISDDALREGIAHFGITQYQIDNWLKKYVDIEKQDKSNPYSGVSFEYNGHTWGMCARDNGVDILLDKQIFKHLEKQGEKQKQI